MAANGLAVTCILPAVGGQAGRGRRGPSNPAQENDLAFAAARARITTSQVQELDPTWRPTPQVYDPNSIEGSIAAQEAIANEAEARLADLQAGAIPGTRSDWGVNRLGKELRDNGYLFKEPTDSPGQLLENLRTGEQVRIMERPSYSDIQAKIATDFYYRYRRSDDQGWGAPFSIPNKTQ